MKRIRTILASVLILCLLFGCGAGLPASAASSKQQVLGPEGFDGSRETWAQLAGHAQTTRTAPAVTLRAVQEKGGLFVLLEGISGSGWAIWGRRAGTAAAGVMPEGWRGASGAAFQIRAEGVSVWSGTAWKTVAGAVSQAAFGNGVELRVDMGMLGLSTTQTLELGLSGDGNLRVPAAGLSMLSVDAAAPAVDPIPSFVADGDAAEWPAVLKVADGGGDVKALSTCRTADRLWIMVQGTNLDKPWNNIYLNTDGNPATGYSNWGQYGAEGAGADVLLQYGGEGDGWAMFTHAGGDWNWAAVELAAESMPQHAYGTADGVQCLELSVPLSAYPAPVPKQFKLSVGLDGDSGFAPPIWEGIPYATVIDPAGYGMVADGKTNEWDTVPARADSDVTPLTLHATTDGVRLYALVTGSLLDTRSDFVIRTARKGYDYGGFRNVQYVVQDGLICRVTKNGTLSRKGAVAAGLTYGADAVTMQCTLKDLGNPGTTWLEIGYIGKSVVAVPGMGKLLAVTQLVKRPSQAGLVFPQEQYAAQANPLKGWLPWASSDIDAEKPAVPVTMAYFDVKWREFEPREGVYDFAALEAKYHLSDWKEHGVRLNLRFVMDDPTSDPTHLDIPDWLYEKLKAENHNGGGGGKWYHSDAIGAGFAPDYNSPLLLAAHRKAIKTLAEKYDDPSVIANVQIGSLGHWGEFHNWPEDVSGKFPGLSVSDQYVMHYSEAFTHVGLGMRKPMPIAARLGLGLFNDVFGMAGSTEEFLGWTRDGWNEIGSYVDAASGFADAAAAQAASKMPDFWKTGFSGGEFANGQVRLYLGDDTVMDTLDQVRDSHTSWMGPCSPADILSTDADRDLYLYNADVLLKAMGYRYVVESVKAPQSVRSGKPLDVALQWNNTGVAPFYRAWPVEVSLLDGRGRVACSVNLKEDIRTWMPGRTSVKTVLQMPNTLRKGTYRLAVAVLDPATGKPGMKLAIQGEQPDGRYVVSSVRVTR